MRKEEETIPQTTQPTRDEAFFSDTNIVPFAGPSFGFYQSTELRTERPSNREFFESLLSEAADDDFPTPPNEPIDPPSPSQDSQSSSEREARSPEKENDGSKSPKKRLHSDLKD